eukprot:PhM_4_TR12431/c0_g1_i1/m.30358
MDFFRLVGLSTTLNSNNNNNINNNFNSNDAEPRIGVCVGPRGSVVARCPLLLGSSCIHNKNVKTNTTSSSSSQRLRQWLSSRAPPQHWWWGVSKTRTTATADLIDLPSLEFQSWFVRVADCRRSALLSMNVDMASRSAVALKTIAAGEALLVIPRSHVIMTTDVYFSPDTTDFVDTFFKQLEHVVRVMSESSGGSRSKRDVAFFVYHLCTVCYADGGENDEHAVRNAPYFLSRDLHKDSGEIVRALHEMIHLFVERSPMSQNTLCSVLSLF